MSRSFGIYEDKTLISLLKLRIRYDFEVKTMVNSQ